MPTNVPQASRIILDMRFWRQGHKYVFFFNPRHFIIINRQPRRGWMAKEIQLTNGKRNNTVRASTGENLEEALAGILENM